MDSKTAKAILAELTLLRAEVALQTEAARNTEAVLLAIAGEKPKQTAMEFIREQGISMWGAN